MHDYKQINFWKKSIDLVENIYNITLKFPDVEKFGLVEQIKRSSISVPSNTGEGSGRSSNRDFSRYLSIAKGSLNELNTQIVISNRLGFIDDKILEKLENDITEIHKMIYKFNQRLED